MGTGILPFRASSDYDTFQKIRKADFRLLPQSLSHELHDLLSLIFNPNTRERPTVGPNIPLFHWPISFWSFSLPRLPIWIHLVFVIHPLHIISFFHPCFVSCYNLYHSSYTSCSH